MSCCPLVDGINPGRWFRCFALTQGRWARSMAPQRVTPAARRERDSLTSGEMGWEQNRASVRANRRERTTSYRSLTNFIDTSGEVQASRQVLAPVCRLQFLPDHSPGRRFRSPKLILRSLNPMTCTSFFGEMRYDHSGTSWSGHTIITILQPRVCRLVTLWSQAGTFWASPMPLQPSR